MSNDLDFLNEAAEDGKGMVSIPKEDQLRSLAEKAQNLWDLETRIREFEDLLSEIKKEAQDLSDRVIPEAMSELDISEFKMLNGVSVKISPFYSAKITDPRGLTWLNENGFGDIIKGEVSIPFPKGFSSDVLANLMKVASNVGLSPIKEETVHPQTLKAFVKECAEKGTTLPSDYFDVFIGRKTKLTQQKDKV